MKQVLDEVSYLPIRPAISRTHALPAKGGA
jgi:hypothetical protein